MTINKEILKDSVLTLPIFYDEGNCEDILTDRITAFYDLLISEKYGIIETEEDRTRIDCILTFRNHIKLMFEEYYLGHQSNAYAEFEMALTMLFRNAPIIRSSISKESLYRARTNDSNSDFRDDEMFHIKYADRSKVSTQRFSFPGLPCLYVGASAYVCWLELNRPSFDKFQVALIEQTDTIEGKSIMDLSINPLTFYSELSKREQGIKADHDSLSLKEYLQSWPIIAACSVAVKNENHSFKPEYIFPQFLLQMILEGKLVELQGIDGIKYMSIKAGRISMRQYESDYKMYTNYVFPTKSPKPTKEGFCKELSRSFKIKNNYSGKELQVISDMIREKGIKFEIYSGNNESSETDNTLIFGTNDRGYSYKNSIFGRIEKILNNATIDDGEIVFKAISNDEIDALSES